MAKYKIAFMPGDGIGKDVLESAKIVFENIDLDIEWIDAEIGWSCWEKYGNALPDHTIDILKETKCAYFGAITSKPGVKGYRSPIVKLRQLFDLYINLRPIKAYEGNPLNFKEGIDIVIFRENTEDLYKGIEYQPIPEQMLSLPGMEGIEKDAGVSLRIITRKGCNRIVKAAFEYAKKHNRKKVTAVHKANVIRVTDGIFLEEARKIAAEYPNIQFEDANIDAIAMWLIKNPLSYDVIVTTNMFGDIISDEAAQLVGGLGFGCSGNIGEKYAVFEPTHGSAPKYAGMYKVNPIAAILAGKLMLDWLGEDEKAKKLEYAIAGVIREGKVKTYDMGGNSSTLEVAKEIGKKLWEKQ
ncbi:MAG: isocitrate/isopropylmalate dehydrogenase family protein [Candidatus Thermoplasmatota archaeon]